jgi:hypothetical protein
MNEQTLIRAFLKKGVYERYHPYLNLEFIRQTQPELHKIFLVIPKLHELQEKEEYSVGDLQAFFYNQYPTL